MDIVAFEPGLAASLARCYNTLVEPVPECPPVPAERFASPEALRHKRLRDEAIPDPREGTDANADAIFRELYGDGQPVRLTGQEALDAIRGAD